MKNNKLITSIVLLAVLLGNRLQSQTTFSTLGANTYTVPACVYSINVTCIGGGGAGRGTAGGGGGAGGVTATKLVSVTPGQTYTLVVGAGGVGTAGTSGTDGVTSTFGGNLVVAEGGKGATSTTGAVATTTVNSVGDIITTGGAGGSQNAAGSSGTGLSANGGGGGGANGGTAGAGGAAVGSGGAGGAGGASGAAGTAGSIPGGGGGGAGGNFKGGDGGQGIVIVSEIQSTTSVNNATICPGQIATLNATLGDSYTWSTGETTSSINVSPATTTSYTVTGTGTCSGTAVSTVTVYKPVAVNSSTICTGNATTLYASGPASFSWSTGATTSSITTPTLTTLGVTSYTVTGNNCGVISTAIGHVVVRNCVSQTITTTGTTSWTAPSCVYSVDAEVWGGGGGAGAESAQTGGTGGGGGGAYSMGTVTVTPGTAYSVRVGTGGAGGNGNGGGTAGGDSWFINATTVMAKGGGGGAGGSGSAGGAGGSSAAGFGTVRYSGGNGGSGCTGIPANAKNDLLGGGGGASAGPGGNGGNGGNAVAVVNTGCGAGGVAPIGGGNGGDGSCVGFIGQGSAGNTPGGGAGGSTDGTSGATGSKGQVVLTYELSTPAVTVTPSAEICPGTTATLTATGAGAYTWSPTTGLSPTTGATVIASPTVTTTYTVTGTKAGCTVTATAKSVVTFTTCCVPATVTLTSAAGTNSQIVCVNAPITTITYTIGGGGLGATVNGLPTGITGTYSGGIFTMSGSLSALGTYNYTVVTSGGCAPVTTTGTIVVTSDAAITLTSAAGTNAQSLCVNTPLTKIIYTISGGGTGATVSGLPAGVSGSYNSGVYTISGTPTATGTFNYTVTTTGVCTQTLAVGAITVNPYPVLSINNITICVGTVGSITAGGANSYSWSSSSTTYTVSPANTLTDGPASTTTYSLTGTSLGCSSYTTAVINVQSSLSVGFTSTVICINNSTILTATGATSYTWTPGGATTNTLSVSPLTTSSYTVSGTMGTCSGTGTGTVTVKPDAAIALTSGAGTNAQTLCLTDALATITYTISGGGTGAIVNGLPSGVSGSYSSGIYTISGTPTVTGTFNYTVTTTGSCLQTSATGSIIINPNAALGLSSVSGSDNQTVCVNTVLSSITYTISGGATSATVTGLPAGITSFFSSNILTISGTPTAVSTQTVASTYTVTTAGTCTQTSVTGTITVIPNAFLGVVGAASQTLCINTPLTNITYTVSGGATGANVTGLPTGLTGTYSSGTLTISGIPTVVGTFGYTVNTTGSCVQTSATGTIVGKPNTIVDLISGAGSNAQVLCLTDVLTTITYSLSGGATNAAVTGLPAGVTGDYAANVVTISGTPTVLGTFNYTLTTAGGCAPVNVFGSIVINPNAAIALTSSPTTTTQTLCYSDVLVPITYTVSGGGTGANITGLPSGVTGVYSSGVVTISGTPTVLGTYDYTVTTVGSCTQTSVTGVITINSNAAIGLTSGTTNQTVCINTPINTITYTISGGGTGATITGLPSGISGSYSSPVYTISGSPSVKGSFNYTLTTTGVCAQKSMYGVINIDTLPVAISGGNTTICENASYTLVNGEADYANGSILWTENGSGTITPGSETTLTPTYKAVAADAGKAITMTMTVTSTNSCFPKSAPATYTINVDHLPIASPGITDTLCVNDSIAISGAGSNYGTILWTSHGSGTLTNKTTLSPQYKASSADQGENIILIMTVTSTNACAVPISATTSATTIINVRPTLTAFLTAQQSVCQNAAAPVLFTANQGTPDYTFNYTETLNGVQTNKTVKTINGNNVAVIGAPTDTPGTVIYNLTSVQDMHCTKSLTLNTQTVTVNPLPEATINKNEKICRDSVAKPIVLKGLNGTAPYIFSLTINNDSVIVQGHDSALITPQTEKTGSITYSLLSVTDNMGCSQTQSGTATITVLENPHAIFTINPEHTSILEPEITITDASIAANSWMWDFGDGTFSPSSNPQTHTYADTGTYKIKLILSNGVCKDSTSEIVRINLPLSLYVPNTFTPNGDGFNDVFKAEADGFKKFEMFIFDRWGQLIFHSDDINKGWDGKANGGSDVAQIDTYVYVIVIADLKKHDNTYRGTVNLVK